MNHLTIRLAIPMLLLISGMQAATYNLVTNFNASDNPSASSTFSYGAGGTPGAFLLDNTMNLTCFSGYGTGGGACSSNGNAYPNVDSHVWNNTGSDVTIGTVIFRLTDITLDPTGTAGDIVRFTAPITGTYSVSGNFEANDTSHVTTNVFIYANSTQLFSNTVGSNGSVDPFSLSNISLSAGNTIDFIVRNSGGTDYLSTGLNGTITGPAISSTPEPGSMLLVAAVLPLFVFRKRLVR